MIRTTRLLAPLLACAVLSACGAAAPSGVVTGGAAPSMPETTASPIDDSPPPAPPATPAATRTTPPSSSTPPAALAGPEWTRLPTTAKVVALTFDAGGNNAGVASILATLAQEKVPATFFLTGRWTEVYPADARRIAATCTVGNHTQTHPHLTALSDAQVAAEVTQGEQSIRSATGRSPRPLFRFPYGDSNARVLADVQSLGYGGIRWTVDTLGWEGRGAGQTAGSVVARAVGAATPGEIVLMHAGSAQDGTTLDADALSRVIAGLRGRGYDFVSVAAFTAAG
ncbi:MAG TPA: polysaccharide deacetylase family protein [Candidatus Angelobacter sp.]|jgi:peptidoglycan/xylan/chitin deacetylase (PgdA/CDA1 family)|nr:polysaccharide deacetylase family protein [Candidatus Angelobacter sp.]